MVLSFSWSSYSKLYCPQWGKPLETCKHTVKTFSAVNCYCYHCGILKTITLFYLLQRMLSLISFIPAQVHDEQHRRRELAERHMASSNLNGHVSAAFPSSPSMAQTLPNLYTLLISLETAESKWRRRKIEVQHTLQQHVTDVKRN